MASRQISSLLYRAARGATTERPLTAVSTSLGEIWGSFHGDAYPGAALSVADNGGTSSNNVCNKHGLPCVSGQLRPALHSGAAYLQPRAGLATLAAGSWTSPACGATRWLSSAAPASAPDPAASPSGDAGQAAEAPPLGEEDARLLAARGQLMDSLAVCLGLQQLDALLARQQDPAVFDELLLLTALDTAHRLCNSASSSAVPLAASAASAHKSASEAASDVLTRLSELLIQRLSEQGGLSAEGAVRALRTLATLRFNPAGDYAGLMTMAVFYRETVLPKLDPEWVAPELAARAPQLLIDLYFAFSRLFDVAARRERAIQAQLQATQMAEEDAAARRADDEEAADGAGGSVGAAAPPWQRGSAVASGPAGASVEGGGVALGDRQLYLRLSRMLSAQGALSNVPSKSLGTLATAMTTAHLPYHPLAQSIATQTLLRLQGGASAAAAAAGIRVEALPSGSDAMETSTLSNILSCLAKMGFEHETLCDAIANWMLQRLSRPVARAGTGGGAVGGVRPHHIVDIAVAFTRLRYENTDFLTRSSSVLLNKLTQSPPNSVAMMAWAVANSRSGRSPEFAELLDALAKRMVVLHRFTSGSTSGSGSPPPPVPGSIQVVPRHLACIVFALARVGHLNTRLLDAVAADVVMRADSYQARQLCNVLRAFTLLGSYRPEMYDAACAVLTQRLRATAKQSAAALAAAPPEPPYVFGPQNYADVAWSVALAGHAPLVPELMELLAERIAETAAQMGKASLVRAAQSLAVANPTAATRHAFDAIAQASRPLLVDLGPPYLAALVDAFAEVEQPVTEDFWVACMDAVGLKLPHMERPRADMQGAVQRLAAAFRRHPATAALPGCQSHYVVPMLEELERQWQQPVQAYPQ